MSTADINHSASLPDKPSRLKKRSRRTPPSSMATTPADVSAPSDHDISRAANVESKPSASPSLASKRKRPPSPPNSRTPNAPPTINPTRLAKRMRAHSSPDIEPSVSTPSSHPLPHLQPSIPATSSPTTQRTHNEARVAELIPLLQFWLSAPNLSKDRHLLTALTADTSGWTPIAVFQPFKRVTRIRGTNVVDLAAALTRLRTPALPVEVDRPNLRFRVLGMQDAVAATLSDADARTVWVRELPTHAGVDALVNAFQHFGPVVHVSIPRWKDGRAKGFAFVELATVVAARNAVSATQVSAFGKVLVVTAVEEWHAFKVGRRRTRRERRIIEGETVRPRPTKDAAVQDVAGDIAMRESSVDGDGMRDTADNALDNVASNAADNIADNAADNDDDGDIGECTPNIHYQRGLLLRIRGLSGATEKVTRGKLYDAFEAFGPVSFVEFKKGADECVARFIHWSGCARGVAELGDGPNGSSMEVHTVEEEENGKVDENLNRNGGVEKGCGGKLLGAEVRAERLSGGDEENYWRAIYKQRDAHAASRARREAEQTARRVKTRPRHARRAKK